MPDAPRSPYQYAIVRVVPRVERGERLNVGVVLLCRPRRFLGRADRLDEARLRALAPDLDPATVRPHLEAIAAIAAGDPDAPDRSPGSGPPSVSTGSSSPRLTIIQPSEVHTGLCDDPERELERLVESLVA